MGGRVVEGTGLENRQAGNRLVGSNPTPSAKRLFSEQRTTRLETLDRQGFLCPTWLSDDAQARPWPPNMPKVLANYAVLGGVRLCCGLVS